MRVLYCFYLFIFCQLPLLFGLDLSDIANKLKDFAKNTDKLKEAEQKIKEKIMTEIMKQALKDALNKGDSSLSNQGMFSIDNIFQFLKNLTNNQYASKSHLEDILNKSIPAGYDYYNKKSHESLFNNTKDLEQYLENILTTYFGSSVYHGEGGNEKLDFFHTLLNRLKDMYKQNQTIIGEGSILNDKNFNFTKFADYALKYNSSFDNFSDFLSEFSTYKGMSKLMDPNSEEGKLLKDLSTTVHTMMKDDNEAQKIIEASEPKGPGAIVIVCGVLLGIAIIVVIVIYARRILKRRNLGHYNEMEKNPLNSATV